MGTNVRLLVDHLGRAPHNLVVTPSSQAVGYEAINGEDGSLHTFYRGTSTADQTLMYDAGAGNTKAVDYVALADADLLVAVACHVSVQWSNDAVSGWIDAFPPLTPIVTGDLAQPTARHYVKEWTSLSKRAWRIRLYGTPTSPATLAGWQLGARTELVQNPLVDGQRVGVERPFQGRDLQMQWGRLQDAEMRTLLAALALVTPTYPVETPISSDVGHLFNSLPHWWYDPIGATLQRGPSTPMLLPVGCLTPEAVMATGVAHQVTAGPTLSWRQLI